MTLPWLWLGLAGQEWHLAPCIVKCVEQVQVLVPFCAVGCLVEATELMNITIKINVRTTILCHYQHEPVPPSQHAVPTAGGRCALCLHLCPCLRVQIENPKVVVMLELVLRCELPSEEVHLVPDNGGLVAAAGWGWRRGSDLQPLIRTATSTTTAFGAGPPHVKIAMAAAAFAWS